MKKKEDNFVQIDTEKLLQLLTEAELKLTDKQLKILGIKKIKEKL